MRSGQPPRLATWLLERFCADPGLCGDMIEQYREGRSTGWYWKQAVLAVGTYPISQIVEHKWLTMRAIFTGWLIWYVFNETLLRGVLRPRLGMDTTMLRAMYFLIAYALWLANGWVIAKLHRPYSSAMVLAFVIWSLIQSVGPIYTAIVSTIDGSQDGTALAWEVTLRVAVVLFLMSGGILCVYRDQLRQTRTAAQDWRPGSPRALAAR